MDPIVEAALKKWPQVPHCWDWLGLDARGDWYLRDDPTQAAGPFARVKGSRLQHEGLCDFIGRNYQADEHGAWYFQNGPQRVYVELEAAPWVWRLAADGTVRSHTGRPATVQGCWLDESDRLFLHTDVGFGLLFSLDTLAASDALDAGRWPAPQVLPFAEMPGRFGYRLSPAADRQRTP
ncbi:DUF2946 family protein [Aquabacterium sp. J223]|uniref:DUF2946 family protein n=1 Tax=Aquabacterium sp. J223 TaxID=2898431 RepID=UPI0021AE128D|nr:DUF2946 family protein [Aquabacterium sp. J223]UUX96048.1 DUF2946 family protein [Aquabacterium sp. J223]